MRWKTHIVIGLAVALYFSNFVNNPYSFIVIVLFATLVPDVDSGFSYLGKRPIFRPIQWTTKHRGIFHSYTLCIFISILIALFFPPLALPFFLGYSFHLIEDSYTVRGIKPFWPLKFVSKGPIKTGGRMERVLFHTFLLINAILIITMLAKIL